MAKDTVDPATLNKPRLERREAVISAKEILEELGKHTSDRAPEYGLYLMKIAGQKAMLYGLANEEVIIRAEQILHYTEKGFTPTVSDTTLDGRKKLDILEEKGLTERHDTVPDKRIRTVTSVPPSPFGAAKKDK